MFKRKKINPQFENGPALILAGNPNTGKSLIFNYLTRQYAVVSNYPGTTVDISKGVGRFSGREFTVIDTPGTNSLFPSSEDEAVTRRIILEQAPQVILQVIDSKNLKRSLNLTQELSDLEIPLVLVLNMSDEAGERGIRIDSLKLSEIFRVKSIQTVATTREGLSALSAGIAHSEVAPLKFVYDKKIEEAIEAVAALLPDNSGYKRFKAVAIICGDEEVVELLGVDKQVLSLIKDKISVLQKEYPLPLRLAVQKAREKKAKEITDKVVSLRGAALKKRWQGILSRLSLYPVSAIPMALLLIYLMYKFVGEFAAGTLVNLLEEDFFGGYLIPWLNTLSNLAHLPFWLHDFILGEYGVISMAITYALAIIFPIVTAFFIFFGILEDSGYLPRLCVLLDKLFHPIGLNGKAVLPFVLGLGCDTMATLTTRTLDTKKERVIATMILALAIPCSAQLGVIMGMLGGISATATVIWLGVIIFSGFGVGFLLSRIIPGGRSALIQEIPPIRLPQISNILLKTWARLKWYLKEAVPLFVLGTAILFILDKIGALKIIEKTVSPLVTGLLGLPQKTTAAFLIGFLRRDYGAAGLYVLRKAGELNNLQALVSLVVITLFVPCIAQFFVTIKERGAKTAAAILCFTFIYAFIAGGLLNLVLRALKISL